VERHALAPHAPAVVVVVVSLVSSLAYVGLFCQAFAAMIEAPICAADGGAGLDRRHESCWAVSRPRPLAAKPCWPGSPENEFPAVASGDAAQFGRGALSVDAATDPVGALFIFPVLASAAMIEPGSVALLVAALTSLLVQVGVSAAAQALRSLSCGSWPPRRRRTAGWCCGWRRRWPWPRCG